MGFFSGLGAEAYDRQYSDRQLIARIAGYFRPHTKFLVWIVLTISAVSGSGAAMPIVVSRGMDMMVSGSSQIEIYSISGIILCLGLFQWGANWIRRRLISRTIGDVVLQLREDGFRASITHDLSFFDKFPSGKIVSRITSDTREFGQLVTLVTDLVSQIIQAIILGIVLVRIERQLSLYLFGFLPVLFLVAVSFRKLARQVTRTGMQAMANVNAAIKETVSGIAIAKNFRQEKAIFEEFDEANKTSYRVNVKRGFVLSLIFPVLRGLEGIGVAILTYAGGVSAILGNVTIGNWYLFLLSLERFFFPILNLSAFWAQVQSGLSAAERIFALIDTESDVKQTGDHIFHQVKGSIHFKQLGFSYTGDEKVFDQFNLAIKPGESVALVGHTGAGKSSIAKLISRFYEFQVGEILIDGRDIRTLDLYEYREKLGIVTQTPFLFSGTVMENIRYANDKMSADEIYQLAGIVGNGEWLDTLPDGLHTEVGERGGRLSMGQRQLIALMRVIAHSPAIFILDEATASIDPFTEWQIQEALKIILSRSTSILVAHRLSTVKAADRILVLENGRIIEEGSHDLLLALGGHYANLYNTYFRHQSLAYIEERKNPGMLMV